jgi:hypothetical protein
MPAKFSGIYVSLEDAEANDGSRNRAGDRHGFRSWLSIGLLYAMVNPGEILLEVLAKYHDSLRDILLDRGQP